MQAAPDVHSPAPVSLALTFDDVLLVPAYSEVLPHAAAPASQLTEALFLPTPILSAAMDTVTLAPMAIAMAQAGGLGVVHKNLTAAAQAVAVAAVKSHRVANAAGACVDAAGHLAVGAAVGVGADGLARAKLLADAGVDLLIVDTAHGHSRGVLDAVASLRAAHPQVAIAAGNVATSGGVRALAQAGAQIIKVGIGPGSICTTRQISGVGVPQFSAIVACAAALVDWPSVTLIADGGIRTSGDMVKALAAGAHAVMVGSLLAGADEAPGTSIRHAGRSYRSYRGMGSLGAMQAGSADRYFQGESHGSSRKLVPEGIEAAVPATGPVGDTLDALVGGLRAGMGYLGAADLTALRAHAQFVRQSTAGLHESRVHDVAPIAPQP